MTVYINNNVEAAVKIMCVCRYIGTYICCCCDVIK